MNPVNTHSLLHISRQLKLQLAPLALAGMSLRNVQHISSDVENHFKMLTYTTIRVQTVQAAVNIR